MLIVNLQINPLKETLVEVKVVEKAVVNFMTSDRMNYGEINLTRIKIPWTAKLRNQSDNNFDHFS